MIFRAATGMRARVLAAALLPASAAVTLQDTHIVRDASRGRDVTVRASNIGKQPALTQRALTPPASFMRREQTGTSRRRQQTARPHGALASPMAATMRAIEAALDPDGIPTPRHGAASGIDLP
ncbi:hypothetical protein [Stenotrophomonas sp. B1-1]|uniref:hypothetical protein n=1 Tax=Stenotrophomonas sp. B1-1 TaxID=2710648 RepID=UPI001F086CB8|nr:hypothetical protein [Stenotrophomonas sp. B1-1]